MPRPLSSVAVYLGSSMGADPDFAAATKNLGGLLAARGIRLVYGGGRVGLMGVLADAVLRGGGSVTGVITHALEEKEISHHGLMELTVVHTMHERKAMMADRADGFIMLPGGYGTMDEFFEVLTWTQLGIHVKPCGILDVNGYFGPLLGLLDHAAGQGFLRDDHREMVLTGTDPAGLLDRMAAWTPPATEKWLDPSER
jgi:uncharacterized protein (TIGR00730 family)